MHIKLINKKIHYNSHKVKCAIGKRGITSNKVEGDNKTPKGSFRIKEIYYRKDRVKKLKTFIKKIPIKKNMGWCDDSNSKYYNKLIKFPFIYRAEKMFLNNNTYDILIVIDFNMKPIKRKKGSAIFIHIAKKKLSPTKGCIAITKKNMRKLISKINKRSKITIY